MEGRHKGAEGKEGGGEPLLQCLGSLGKGRGEGHCVMKQTGRLEPANLYLLGEGGSNATCPWLGTWKVGATHCSPIPGCQGLSVGGLLAWTGAHEKR